MVHKTYTSRLFWQLGDENKEKQPFLNVNSPSCMVQELIADDYKLVLLLNNYNMSS